MSELNVWVIAGKIIDKWRTFQPDIFDYRVVPDDKELVVEPPASIYIYIRMHVCELVFI